MLKLKDLKPTEAEITKEIRGYLDVRGIPHFKKHQGLGSQKGISDIIGCVQCKICHPCTCPMDRIGRFLAIEVKVEGKSPSNEQELFLQRYRLPGGICFVARSVEDVERELKKGLIED